MSPKGKTAHIDYALLARAHPKRHPIHKFWARKPHNVVADYISHYSKNARTETENIRLKITSEWK